MSNSLLIKTPIVSSNIKSSVLATNPSLSNLGPGTLVFANGTVMPVVQTPPQLPILSTIFTNPAQTKIPTFIVVSCNTNTASSNKITVSTGNKSPANSTSHFESVLTASKAYLKDSTSMIITRPVIKPKTCVTRTTQINKVPIPALSSRYNSHSCLENIKTHGSNKKIDLNDFKNENKNSSKSNLKNKSDKRKVEAKSLQEAKKHKGDSDENKTLPSPTTNTEVNVQSTNNHIVELSKTLVIPEKPVSGIIEEETVKETLDTHKTDQESNKSINISLFNFAKGTPTSAGEICKVLAMEVPHVKGQTSNYDKESHIDNVFDKVTSDENTCNKISKPNEIAECHNINETSIVENKRNYGDTINEIVEPISNKTTKTGCPSLTSDQLPTTHSSAIATCNKQELKTFDNNVSLSESVTKSKNINDLKTLEINLPQSELSNDIFASFVPTGCQNPGSTSPTAAFLLAFPLVSSGIKVTEVIGDENSESHAGTPNLLQIGTMEVSKPTQSYSDSLTPNILNFENFSFFSNKDNCGGFYNNCGMVSTSCQPSTVNVTSSSKANSSINKMTPLPPQNNNLGNQDYHSRLDAADHLTFLTSNKPEINNIKTSNQSNFKTDNTEKASASNIKCSNVNVQLEPLRSAKDMQLQSYISTSYNYFNRGNERGNATNNILDMNTPFSSKLLSNENYTNKFKSNISGQAMVSKPSNSCTNYPHYRDSASFITNSAVLNKNYNSVYTSAASNDYFYNPSGSEGDNRHFNPPNCSNYSDYRKIENYNNYSESPQVYHKDKFNQNTPSKMKTPGLQNKPINWMTSPSTTVSYKPEYFLPSLSKEHNFNSNLSTNTFTMPSNTYFNTSSVYNTTQNLNSSSEIRKTADLTVPTYNSYQRTESEENQISWSPSKIPQFLDPTHSHTFVSSTLPTLVGDLALNNTPISEQKSTKDKNRPISRKVGNCENQSIPTNFLSVSQLVEHNQEHASAKVIARRSSGNRSKTNTPKSKRITNRSDANKDISNYQKNDKINQHKNFEISVATNLFEPKQQQRNNKNVSSSYSAEALIGNQLSTESSAKRNIINQNKSVHNFLSDNIVSYFPAIDVTQDNGYMQTNQPFQANSFTQNFTTSFQNNTYGPNNFIPNACTLTSTYMPNNNFMHSSNNQEFLTESQHLLSNNNVQTKDKNNYMRNYYRSPDKNEKNVTYKKTKKRSINESTLPSFDIPFLSMPGAINSPILPDDFHTTYLPPTTLYSCKNPLYSKPNSEITTSTLIPHLPAICGSKSGIQHSEISPSANSVGTSLTNFNLSTIFPEINKIPFSSKSAIPFGTFGT